MTRVGLALSFTAAGLALLAAPATAAAELRFRDCGEADCARLSVPLDRSGAVPGTLSLRVKRYVGGIPRRGVTLLLAGLPGQAMTSSRHDEWRAPHRDLVIFDQRGSGEGALRCRDLEAATATDAGREAEACATLLGDRRAFFRTSDTVEDIEALRAELGAERLSIAAGSYGAYVAQRYAMRYPNRVERLLLESPVDAAGLDPLYRDSPAAVRRMLPALCRLECRRFTTDAVADTARLVQRLAAEPLRGRIVGPSGHRRTAFLTRQELLYLLMAGDYDLFSRPDYPAAVVSALRGDAAPILRLKRRATGEPAVAPLRPRAASAATYAATLCEEVRFPWPWHATPAERYEGAYRAETAMDTSLIAPFDPATLVRSDLMRLCRRWPTASAGPPPEPGSMPDVPVLVLAAPEAVRSPVESARRAAARFPAAKLLEATGVGAGVGYGLSACAEIAVLRFLSAQRVQDRCPRRGPLVPPGAPAPDSLRELAPVPGVPGRRGRLLRALGVTFGDLVDSFYSDGLLAAGLDESAPLRGGGLRGGHFAAGENVFLLDRYEFVPGVRLSSRSRADADGLGPMRIDGPSQLDGVVRLLESDDDDWTLGVRGRIAGRRVRARVRIESRLLDVFSVDEDGGGTVRLATPARAGAASGFHGRALRLLRPALSPWLEHLAEQGPNVPANAPGSCRRSLLRSGPGRCSVR